MSYCVDKIFLEPDLFSSSIIRLVKMNVDLFIGRFSQDVEIADDKVLGILRRSNIASMS